MASDEELDVADISLPSTGKRKIKSASRKKQTSACDGCRKGKTRCDGNTPCGRCIKRGIVCTYSPQKRRGVRKKPKLAEEVPISLEAGVTPKLDGSTAQGAQQAKSEDSSDALPNHDDLLDVYFKYINELLLRPITREELEQHTSKASLMQYNVALAFAARCSNKKKMAASFERRARTLAGDLFDDFTQETATAFALLTAYYWGQEEAKCKFYGTVTRGLCRQLAPSIDPAAVIMIEVVASCCLVQWEQYIGDLLDRIRSALETTTETKFRRQLQIALLLLEVKYGLIRAYPVNDDQKYLAILFDTEQLRQNMSPEVANFLERKLNAAENLLLEVQNPTNLSNIWPLVQVFFGCFRSMLYFAKGDLETAEKLSRQVVDTASEYQNLLYFSPPAIVHCIHYSFCVAYTRGNIPLAVRTTGLLRKISTVLPIAEVPLWSDTRYLKALLNQSGANNANRPQTPSLSTSQSSFGPSEQESRFFAEASHDFDALKYVPISTPLHVPRGAASNSSVNNAQTPSSQFLVFPENMRTLPTEPYFSSTPASSNRAFNPSRQNLSCMYMLNSRFMNEPRSGVNPFDKEANLNPFFETDFAATEPLRWDM